MQELDVDRFNNSDASTGNRGNRYDSRRKASRSWSYAMIGSVAFLIFTGIILILRTDQRESSFDELVTTGGAVRRSVDINGDEVSFKIKTCKTRQCKNVKQYIVDSRNTSVDPCDNFYTYACGGWMKKNKIPKTSSTFSTFTKLNQNVEKILYKILSDKKKEPDPLLKKTKNFYKACINMNAINKKGAKPLMKLIEDIGGWALAGDDSWVQDDWDIEKVLKDIHSKFTSSGGPLFSVHVSDDPDHSDKHIIEVDQAGPSLPREIYMKDTEDNLKTLRGYTEYLEDVAKLLKCKGDIKKMANETVEFERELAKISVPDDAKQELWFHKIKFKELSKAAPDYDWMKHVRYVFKSQNKSVTANENIVVPGIEYLKKMMTVVKRTSKKTLSNYIVWSIIQDEIPYLSQPFLNARKHYKEKVLGTKGLRKRWKTCVAYTNEYLGELLGKLYKESHFKESTKTSVEDMITNIRKAFMNNVKTLTWMDKKTKDKVNDKANAMKDQVGYPSYITNATRFKVKFAKLDISDRNFFGNRVNIIKFAHQRMLKKINKNVDKIEWPMDPQTINAMYSFNTNGMIIPAGILQPPFFHGEKNSVAMAYGAIGAILGHEMTHGFDNTGRKFNKHGELEQWWTKKSQLAFKKRSKCMIDQYNNYKVGGKYQVNGNLTLGENIADNGGFKTALRAYNDWLDKSKKDIVFKGLEYTNEQLFHVAFGQAYCSNSRPNEQYLATLNDRHTEEEFRVIGTLSNSVEFAKAFNCKLGTRMNPEKKCSVWVNEQKKMN